MNIQEIYVSSGFNPNQKDEEIDSNDVIVTLNDGRKFLASFFTYHHICEMKTKPMDDKEYFNRRYFWASNMVLIKDCSYKTVKEVVSHMIEDGDFLNAFKKIN